MLIEDKETEDKSEDASTEDTDTEESEDTSEEDTSGDDSEEESEDEDDSEEVSDEDEGEGRKQLRKFFADPKSVPKELRPAFKAMQAQFTRKMQAASSVVTRAQAFDKIVADPQFRTWAENRAKNLKSTRGRANSEEDIDDDDTEADSGKLTSKSIQKLIRSAVSEAIEPMRKEQQDQQVQSEFKQFRKSHPDWQLYKDDMKELMDQHPTLTYDMAYEFATRGIDSEDMRKQSIKSKKNAKTSKPSGVQGKETMKPAKGISVRDSYALAKKMLGLNKEK